MKTKIYTLLAAMLLSGISAFAQELPTSGFYRIQHVNSQRYLTMNDRYFQYLFIILVDLGAYRTFSYSDDKVVSNPASVFYLERDSSSDRYTLRSGGDDLYEYELLYGHEISVKPFLDGTYGFSFSISGITKYFYEYDCGNYGGVGFADYNPYNKALRWNLLPFSSSDDTNYFGIKSDLRVDNYFYKSFCAGFAFTPASKDISAYYVTKVDKAKKVAVYTAVTDPVPAATPVFLRCASPEPTDNRLNFTIDSPSSVSGNLLSGVYFCNTPNLAEESNHINCVAYNERTMRVLGKTSDGSLGFIKAPDWSLYIETDRKTKQTVRYIPANTAYLVVDADAPDELKLVSQEELLSDVNSDGVVDVADIATIISVMAASVETDPVPVCNADVNGDGVVDVADIASIISIMADMGGGTPYYTQCPDDHHPHMIDLDLLSGTKWACCNVGANTPEDYGSYFAWGETQPKDVYNWDTYQYGSSEDNVVDIGLDIAGTGYDAATASWGTPWRMPSKAQIQELLKNTTMTWTTQNGVKGRKFTGRNGGSIFFPYAGCCNDGELHGAGSRGYYWSSSLYESSPYYAFSLFFDSGLTSWRRYLGLTVRPVR